MRRLYLTICSAWTWFVLGLTIILWCPALALVRLVTAPFDAGHYWAGLLFRKLAVVTVALNPLWKVRVSGIRITDPRRPYVVVSNHESLVDILLISHLPWEMKWLSKAELFRLPFLGWDMWLAGDIPVERGTARSAVRALQRCRAVLARRVSVIIFPEGTRSKTGELLPFKDGAFHLAIETGVPILPLAVSGTRTALAKRDWRVAPAVAEVRVLPPIETTGMTKADVAALSSRVRDLISRTRLEMQQGATSGATS
ncbi:MAG TPA: lysophospholipid acyltransferase family protein [Gemmatimonadales bacterium]|nr:lysophospholipid acyltransferase family protein [Gemmatimonadales bacterium]